MKHEIEQVVSKLTEQRPGPDQVDFGPSVQQSILDRLTQRLQDADFSGTELLARWRGNVAEAAEYMIDPDLVRAIEDISDKNLRQEVWFKVWDLVSEAFARWLQKDHEEVEGL